jgi:hypothetical protein
MEMAAKVETLRISVNGTKDRRPSVARLGTAIRNWARAGQLGESSSAAMRRYSGAR